MQLEVEDKKIKLRTVVGGIIAGGVASIIGGILWGLQMIYSGRIFYIFFFGLIILCYGLIKIATRQTGRNTFILIATIISIILAILIGQLLYEIIGYQK